jgi:hypothetical protein
MTPNILEAMKWFAEDLKGGPQAYEFTWLDLGVRGREEYTTVGNKLAEGVVPLVLFTPTLPKDLPMPFEMLGVTVVNVTGNTQPIQMAITFHREGDDMQVVFRHPDREHLFLTQMGAKSAAGENDLWFDGGLVETLMRTPRFKDKPEAFMVEEYSDIARRVYGMAMLDLMDKQKRTAMYTPIPNPANDKRIRKGKKPLFEWKVIDVTAQHVAADNSAPTGRTHASPRRHVRRGHQRKLSNGTTIWIKQMMVGKIEFGYIHHSYTTGESK